MFEHLSFELCSVNMFEDENCRVESSKKKGNRPKNKKEQMLVEGVDSEEMTKVRRSIQLEQSDLNSKSNGGKSKGRKKRKEDTKQWFEEDSIKAEVGEYEIKSVSSGKEGSPYPGEDDSEYYAEKDLESHDKKADQGILKKKKNRLLKEAAKAKMRGICYLSRVPPHMDPLKLRQVLSQYGEIQRIYLVPEDSARQVQRKRAGGFRGQLFSEGWVEFTDKRVAKKVANLLNGEQIGGKKRSSFYYDIWNIKYLSKFKWDDLTEETAYKNAIREQKLALEISAAKRERDFYLSKVDKSRALSSIEERLKKKQKVQEDSEMNSELDVSQKLRKVIRNFPQTQPVADSAEQNKQRLSKSILAGVFGSSK